jgi:hypothetical protein
VNGLRHSGCGLATEKVEVSTMVIALAGALAAVLTPLMIAWYSDRQVISGDRGGGGMLALGALCVESVALLAFCAGLVMNDPALKASDAVLNIRLLCTVVAGLSFFGWALLWVQRITRRRV